MDLVPWLINGGVASAFAAAFVFGIIHSSRGCPADDLRTQLAGKDAEIREYKAAVALERQRSDAQVASAALTRDVMRGIHEIARAENAKDDR